ncbi:MAG TPA: tyrosine-type recombinase/integrase [Vicinamibacterales bacterium]|nr:tyrosine-type recombinase/integrase [Vicinamibacterales bacterium]
MSLWKRGTQYWMDVTINGQRHREPLGTSDWREAKTTERRRVTEIERRPPDPAHRRKTLGPLDVKSAIDAYVEERRSQVSDRMLAYWKENARPLAAFFGQTPLRNLDSGMLAAYQNGRRDAGRAPKTINGELSVLRQVLRHAKLWYKFEDDYRTLKNTKPPVGQALTDEQQETLFTLAASKSQWLFAYVAATLAFYCGLRACEIRGLQWKHIDWRRSRMGVRRSKTPAGWRDPSLNGRCAAVLGTLHTRAAALGFAEPDHYLFPWHGRDKKIDPTRAMTSWRSAWRSLRKAAGLEHVRFHDGRHTALTRLAEGGQPDWVIQAQLGHVSPAMMKTYSHVRRKALDAAAAVLEPILTATPAPEETEDSGHATDRAPAVTSQFTSQSTLDDREALEIIRESGSPHWTISATG